MAKPERTYFSRLKLSQFRNYASLSLELDRRHVVLFGENGAGKTNVLEAVSFFTPGRGLRRAAYDSIGKSDGNGSWSVFADISKPDDTVSIGTGIQFENFGLEKNRKVRIDGEPAKTSDDLSDHLRVIWLTPAMDGLFTGPAADRRRFLDRMVLAIDPAHGRRVADYERTMRNRNKLLKEDYPDFTWLDAIEVQLCELAVAIACARVELVSLLSREIIENNDPGSAFPDALVEIDGSLERLAGEASSSDLESDFLKQLNDGRKLDAAAGRTLNGPHRSDLLVSHRPKSVAASQCSTGEQKALLIGLITAQASLVRRMSGKTPILLLDEIAAHLDPHRRAALYDLIEDLDSQAWMTGTDRSLFDALDDRALRCHVSEGRIETE